MPKVAITDYTFPSLDIETGILQPLGCEVIGRQCKTPAELIESVADADHVITQFAPVNAAVIGAMKKCRVIVRYGIGVDNVDLDASAKKGIPVCNVPDYCIDEVADHTLAFILGLTRQVVPNWDVIRHGSWKIGVPLERMRALRDMTVGLVAFGRIGREVAARLKPFKCKVQVFDPVVDAASIKLAGCVPVGWEELEATSDLITLHCPSTAKTRGMINHESLARMKKGVLLVNASRGDLINTDDLIGALNSGHVSAVALDVTNPEPIPQDSPLLKMDNVIISAHIASTSPKSVHTLRSSAANIVAMAVRGEKLPNIVNGVGR